MKQWINKLQFEKCGKKEYGCHYRASTCPIIEAVNSFNLKNPNQTFRWCSKCDGFYFGKKQSQKYGEIADYEGGLILCYGILPHTHRYQFAYACDCECGEVRQKHHVAPFPFSDEDRDDCIMLRRRRLVEHRPRQQNKIEDDRHIAKPLSEVISNIGISEIGEDTPF